MKVHHHSLEEILHIYQAGKKIRHYLLNFFILFLSLLRAGYSGITRALFPNNRFHTDTKSFRMKLKPGDAGPVHLFEYNRYRRPSTLIIALFTGLMYHTYKLDTDAGFTIIE